MANRWLFWLLLLVLFGGTLLSTAMTPAANPADILAKAQKLIREQNYSEAVSLCQYLIESYPDSPSSDKYLYTLARAYELSGDFKKAVDLLVSYHSRFPKSRDRISVPRKISAP